MVLVVALIAICLIVGLRAKRVGLEVYATLFVATVAFSVVYLFTYFRL